MKILILLASHVVVGGLGFALGIYLLPILSAPAAPGQSEVLAASSPNDFRTEFIKDLKGSDLLHWGEGQVTVNEKNVTLIGEISPGPAYKLYLTPTLVTDEAEFEQVKARSVLVGDVRTFNNFVVSVPPQIDINDYQAIVIWCDAFSEFITAAAYR